MENINNNYQTYLVDLGNSATVVCVGFEYFNSYFGKDKDLALLTFQNKEMFDSQKEYLTKKGYECKTVREDRFPCFFVSFKEPETYSVSMGAGPDDCFNAVLSRHSDGSYCKVSGRYITNKHGLLTLRNDSEKEDVFKKHAGYELERGGFMFGDDRYGEIRIFGSYDTNVKI